MRRNSDPGGLVDGETELQMVQRHIRDGEAIVSRQEAIVQTLQAGGNGSGTAEDLLVMFRKTLADHYEHLARLQPTVKL